MPGSNNKPEITTQSAAERFNMQNVLDDLYARSKRGEPFTSLMSLILERNNVMMALANIELDRDGKEAGSDGLTLADVKRMDPDAVLAQLRFILTGSRHGYRPKPVSARTRKTVYGEDKSNGLACVWDRLAQQCILQILEPICEARFSDNSYGSRPDRTRENAIAHAYRLMQLSHLCFVVEINIRDFSGSVHHPKLIRQFWSIGIRDKSLLGILRRVLSGPIKEADGTVTRTECGIEACGLLTPLMMNVALNEFDQWIDSQWQKHPLTERYQQVRKSGRIDNSNSYTAMRKTGLKEMHILRYDDQIRIFCPSKDEAVRTMYASVKWFAKRLRLVVETAKVRDLRERYMDFLGLKMRLQQKAGKFVVQSRMSDQRLAFEKEVLRKKARHIARPRKGKTERAEVIEYNAAVRDIHNLYRYATDISKDCIELARVVAVVFHNRLKTRGRGNRLQKTGRKLTQAEQKAFGKSKQIRFAAGSGEPIRPVGYVQHKKPMNRKRGACCYEAEGRDLLKKS